MNKNILIIDDDNLTCWGLEKIFSSRGLSVTTACSRKDAIGEFDSIPFGYVFLDVHLPDADGLELIKEIKRISPETKIIVMTGDDSEANKLRAFEEGAFSFVRKPFEIPEIILLVNYPPGNETVST
ncbi:MAG TPA: response regulator [Thermodesulfovibrionales bacterium]|nr:response regulator [Thermodesulfovibrionales bacterium]